MNHRFVCISWIFACASRIFVCASQSFVCASSILSWAGPPLKTVRSLLIGQRPSEWRDDNFRSKTDGIVGEMVRVNRRRPKSISRNVLPSFSVFLVLLRFLLLLFFYFFPQTVETALLDIHTHDVDLPAERYALVKLILAAVTVWIMSQILTFFMDKQNFI